MQLHIVSLPHTEVSTEFNGCAYTAKVLKFCKMMGAQHEIFVYAPDGPSIRGAQLIGCCSREKRISIFGPDDRNRLPAWPTDEQSAFFNNAVIRNLKRNLGHPHESLILLTGGRTHAPIIGRFPGYLCCEPGVGYEGIATDRCAFESYAWMHTVYAKNGINDGRWFDRVIPNYFDPEDFPILNDGNGKYLLFLGRLIARKGPHIAADIAHRCGIPLKVAGAGGKQVGNDIQVDGSLIKDAEYVGPVNIQERAKLLAGAKALLVPTTYIEPFGGVAVEAMFAGTPVVATDWGAFTETVKNWDTGFRFRNLEEACAAVKNCGAFCPQAIRDSAIVKYSLEAVAPQFNRWFDCLTSLWTTGWYK